MLIENARKRRKRLLEKIGEDISQARKRVGMSQTQLAIAIGTKASNISRIENGRQNLTLDSILLIADALGMEFSFGFAEKSAAEPEGDRIG